MSVFTEGARGVFIKRRRDEIFREEGKGSQKLREEGGAQWPVSPERQGPRPFSQLYPQDLGWGLAQVWGSRHIF